MVNVYRSAVIDAPADKVWALIRDFNGLPKWHPAIGKSEIEGGLPGDRVGCVRREVDRLRARAAVLDEVHRAGVIALLGVGVRATDRRPGTVERAKRL